MASQIISCMNAISINGNFQRDYSFFTAVLSLDRPA